MPLFSNVNSTNECASNINWKTNERFSWFASQACGDIKHSEESISVLLLRIQVTDHLLTCGISQFTGHNKYIQHLYS